MTIDPEKVIQILRATRKIFLPQWGNIGVAYQKDQSAHNIVTEMDIRVENSTKEELSKVYPDIEFVGEESGGNREAKSFWLMDPIDGTQHYVRGLPFCTTMLALIENGEVTFSAIYDFINDNMFWAQKGSGAFCNHERLSVSNRTLKDAYICWETHLEKDENKKIYFNLLKKTHLVKTICAGWEFAMIASGKLDARICFDPYGKDYDFAPGCLLVSEAGGVVTNLNSKSFDYRDTNFIAGNTIIHEELASGNFFT